MSTRNKVICLMGPTASGKSGLAYQFACAHTNVELISVDSACVYLGMDIGAAKPSLAELVRVPHHLINIRKVNEPYSAADFASDATLAIADIIARGKVPLLVGGTMLYYKALQQGLSAAPSADASIRQKLLSRAERLGWPALHAELAAVDPIAAKRIHTNDAQRIERALGVYQATGVTQTQYWHEQQAHQSSYEFVNLALPTPDRTLLHEKIAGRFDQMLAQGVVDEVRQLQINYQCDAQMPAMRAVGYRQILAYLNGEYDDITMRERAIIATRQLAKRQITWLRSWPMLQYLPADLDGALSSLAQYHFR